MTLHEQAPDLAARFGRNLLHVRRRVDLSQQQLSVRASVHRTEIGLLENGARVPRLDTIIKLAGAAEAETAEVLSGMVWVPLGPMQGRFYVDR